MMVPVLYEDSEILVVIKPAGIESQRGKSFAVDMESMLKTYLSKGQKEIPYLGIVHRLDRPVTGVMVYAKTKKAAADLSAQFAKSGAHKIYEAFVWGEGLAEKGELCDWIAADTRTNLARIVTKDANNAKKAQLRYEMIPIENSQAFALEQMQDEGMTAIKIGETTLGRIKESMKDNLRAVRIELLTGRHHQIRAQFSHAGAAVVGDTRYGEQKEGVFMRGTICLCAVQLSFCHPKTKKQVVFSLTR